MWILNEAESLWSEITSILCDFMVMNFTENIHTSHLNASLGLSLISWYLMYEWAKITGIFHDVDFSLVSVVPNGLCYFSPNAEEIEIISVAWQYFMHRWRFTWAHLGLTKHRCKWNWIEVATELPPHKWFHYHKAN